jgi:CPA2 family monovalent cation:H+ antiporter-2
VQSGMSLAQIGEFSFIIAGLGLSLGATRDFLYPVAVAVSAITTLTTPWLIRASAPAAAFIDRRLPRPLQTFAALYGSWLERLRAASAARRAGTEAGHRVRRFVSLLVLDAAVLSALIIAISLKFRTIGDALARLLHLAPALASMIVVAATAAAALPLVVGIGRLSRGLGGVLAETALPRPSGKADLDAAPRRTLAVTLQLGVALIAGIVVLAVTQIFLPSYSGPLVLFLVLAGFGVAIWRSVRDLEGHVRAGAQAVVAALGRYARAGSPAPGSEALADVNKLLPGLGEPVAVRIDSASPAVGQSLADLNLRGRSGATVLAISRDGESIVVPTAGERLRAGDVLALAGAHEAIDAAKELLGAG